MANMLYNGVELPELPEYDTSAYPYATIYSRGGTYTLNVCNGAPYTKYYSDYGDSYHFVAPFRKYEISNNTWKFVSSSNYGTFIDYRVTFTIVWSNVDIINPDGTVYLAASEPTVPGETTYAGIDINRAEIFMLGQRLRPSLFGLMSKRIIGYSYNGTIAPKLPELDTSVHKYAIMYLASDGVITIRFTRDRPSYMPVSEGYFPCVIVRAGSTYTYLQTKLSNGVWSKVEYITRDYSDATSDTRLYTPNVIWSNFDIYGSDVQVQFKASTPIPVYE